MTDTFIEHIGAVDRISPATWADLTPVCVLFREDASVAPVFTDEFLSSMDPASWELVNPDYERVALTGLAKTRPDDDFELVASVISFGALTPSYDGEAVRAVAICQPVDDDDALSWLITTLTLETPVELNGEEFLVTWSTEGVLTVGPRAS